MLERPAHRRRRLPATWVALVIFTAACSPAAEDGTSHIEVGDLSGTPLESRFAGGPKPLTGRIAARADGCVTVVIDGVTRLPLWPAGTSVKQRGDDEDGYVVTLAGGVTLTADGASGDGFTAAGIVSTPAAGATGGSEPPGKAESFLGFCAVEAAPVAFPDAATFRAGA